MKSKVIKIILANLLVASFVVVAFSQQENQSKDNPKKKEKVTKEIKKSEENKKQTGERALGVPKRLYKDSEFAPKEQSDSYGWLVFKALFIIAMVVAGFYYFFRFVTKQTGMHLRGEGVIDVMSTVPLGPNKFIQIVDVAGKMLVLGVTDTNINLVSEITEKLEIDKVRLESSKADVLKPGGFQEHMAKYVESFVSKISESKKKLDNKKSQDNYDLKYLKKQKDRLKNISGKDDE